MRKKSTREFLIIQLYKYSIIFKATTTNGFDFICSITAVRRKKMIFDRPRNSRL